MDSSLSNSFALNFLHYHLLLSQGKTSLFFSNSIVSQSSQKLTNVLTLPMSLWEEYFKLSSKLYQSQMQFITYHLQSYSSFFGLIKNYYQVYSSNLIKLQSNLSFLDLDSYNYSPHHYITNCSFFYLCLIFYYDFHYKLCQLHYSNFHCFQILSIHITWLNFEMPYFQLLFVAIL